MSTTYLGAPKRFELLTPRFVVWCSRQQALLPMCSLALTALVSLIISLQYLQYFTLLKWLSRSRKGRGKVSLDCFAKPVIGPATLGRAHWLARRTRVLLRSTQATIFYAAVVARPLLVPSRLSR